MAFSTNSKELLNIGTINSIELVSSSARVTSTKSTKAPGDRQIETPRPIDRTPETPGSGNNKWNNQEVVFILVVSPYFLGSDSYMHIQYPLRIARDCFILASSIVLSWYLHQPESHQQSFNQRSLIQRHRDPQTGPQGHLGPVKTKGRVKKKL